jgi:hypothetical protein
LKIKSIHVVRRAPTWALYLGRWFRRIVCIIGSVYVIGSSTMGDTDDELITVAVMW